VEDGGGEVKTPGMLCKFECDELDCKVFADNFDVVEDKEGAGGIDIISTEFEGNNDADADVDDEDF
jgi:hypothetical protein